MAEQEVVVVEKEEVREETEETKEKKKEKIKEKKALYGDAVFEKRLVELVERFDNYETVAKMLTEEYQTEILNTTVRFIFLNRSKRKRFEKESVMDKSFENFAKHIKNMEERYDGIVGMMDRAKKILDEILDEVEKTEIPNDKFFKAIKSVPIMIAISREILAQLEFLKDEQNKLKDESKTFIYSPIQITNIMGENLTKWAKSGYIEIKKDIPGINLKDLEGDKK